jgi:argininosuccinate synthase
MHLRDSLVPRYAEMVYYGYWFTPERRMLQATMDEAQRTVSGTARMKLYKGQATVAGRRAERSLYDPSIATFEAGGIYDQRDAEGFIRLSALRLRIQALVAKRAGSGS